MKLLLLYFYQRTSVLKAKGHFASLQQNSSSTGSLQAGHSVPLQRNPLYRRHVGLEAQTVSRKMRAADLKFTLQKKKEEEKKKKTCVVRLAKANIRV